MARCSSCGSTNMTVGVDVDVNTWRIVQVFVNDYGQIEAYCDDCGEECQIPLPNDGWATAPHFRTNHHEAYLETNDDDE